MSNTAVLLREELSIGCEGFSLEKFRRTIAANEVLLLGAFLILLQAADGILTLIGVQQFGTSMEGNLLIRKLMIVFGHGPAIAIAKSICIAIIIRLTLLAHRVSWVRQAMGAICCFYLLAAIFPWTYILAH